MPPLLSGFRAADENDAGDTAETGRMAFLGDALVKALALAKEEEVCDMLLAGTSTGAGDEDELAPGALSKEPLRLAPGSSGEDTGAMPAPPAPAPAPAPAAMS